MGDEPKEADQKKDLIPFSVLPVDVRAQRILRRISGTETPANSSNAIPDEKLMDEIANTIRDLLAVIRTGVDHGTIVCISEAKAKQNKTERKAAKREIAKNMKKSRRRLLRVQSFSDIMNGVHGAEGEITTADDADEPETKPIKTKKAKELKETCSGDL